MQKKQQQKKMQQKVYRFLDNLIWIGNGKFSPLLWEYWYFSVRVLSSSPKISDLTENNFV